MNLITTRDIEKINEAEHINTYDLEQKLNEVIIAENSKQFIRNHGSYDREHLQDWLNLFWSIMNEPKDKYDKVLKFIELTILSPKKVRYRDAMSSKHSK